LVDVERARTVKGWKPRRLGGGLGGREQKPSSSHSVRNSSREKYNDSRDRHRQPSGYGGYNRRDDDRKRPRMRSRSRSPKPFKDRPSAYGGASSVRRERSRDRMGSSSRRDRY
jgi:U1 small nuclear ribonucleoprotein